MTVRARRLPHDDANIHFHPSWPKKDCAEMTAKTIIFNFQIAKTVNHKFHHV